MPKATGTGPSVLVQGTRRSSGDRAQMLRKWELRGASAQ